MKFWLLAITLDYTHANKEHTVNIERNTWIPRVPTRHYLATSIATVFFSDRLLHYLTTRFW